MTLALAPTLTPLQRLEALRDPGLDSGFAGASPGAADAGTIVSVLELAELISSRHTRGRVGWARRSLGVGV